MGPGNGPGGGTVQIACLTGFGLEDEFNGSNQLDKFALAQFYAEVALAGRASLYPLPTEQVPASSCWQPT